MMLRSPDLTRTRADAISGAPIEASAEQCERVGVAVLTLRSAPRPPRPCIYPRAADDRRFGGLRGAFIEDLFDDDLAVLQDEHAVHDVGDLRELRAFHHRLDTKELADLLAAAVVEYGADEVALVAHREAKIRRLWIVRRRRQRRMVEELDGAAVALFEHGERRRLRRVTRAA